MKFRQFMGLAAIVATPMTVMTGPAASQFVADDSLVEISREHLPQILQKVSAKFDQPDQTLFAKLRFVEGGYCGYVNATLEYDGFIPFFLDLVSSQVELGPKGKLPDAPTRREPRACR
jgi:hypothetical protein